MVMLRAFCIIAKTLLLFADHVIRSLATEQTQYSALLLALTVIIILPGAVRTTRASRDYRRSIIDIFAITSRSVFVLTGAFVRLGCCH